MPSLREDSDIPDPWFSILDTYQIELDILQDIQERKEEATNGQIYPTTTTTTTTTFESKRDFQRDDERGRVVHVMHRRQLQREVEYSPGIPVDIIPFPQRSSVLNAFKDIWEEQDNTTSSLQEHFTHVQPLMSESKNDHIRLHAEDAIETSDDHYEDSSSRANAVNLRRSTRILARQEFDRLREILQRDDDEDESKVERTDLHDHK
jgi:hypothetical protein